MKNIGKILFILVNPYSSVAFNYVKPRNSNDIELSIIVTDQYIDIGTRSGSLPKIFKDKQGFSVWKTSLEDPGKRMYSVKFNGVEYPFVRHNSKPILDTTEFKKLDAIKHKLK